MNFTPSTSQITSALRWLLATFGGGFATWAALRLNISATDITSLLGNETIIGLVASGVALVWGLISHTKANQITTVANLPEVNKVELAPAATPALVEATPDNVVKK